MSARFARRTPSSSRPAPGEGGTRVPLWRDVHDVEASLRPVVAPRPAAAPPLPLLHLAAGTVVVGGASVAAAVTLYRRGLVIARLQRPRQLQGPPIAALPRFVRPRVVAAAWQPAASALGVGLALWLLTVAHPRWRRPMQRWGWIVGLLGVAVYGLVTLRMMPLPR